MILLSTSTQGQHKLIWIMTAIWSANQPIRYLGMLPKGLASKYIVSKFNIEKKKINLTIHFQSSKTSHCKLFNRLQKCGLLLVFNSLALKIKQFIIQHSTTQQKGQYCTYQTSEFLLNNKHFPYLFPYAYHSNIFMLPASSQFSFVNFSWESSLLTLADINVDLVWEIYCKKDLELCQKTAIFELGTSQGKKVWVLISKRFATFGR